MKRIATIALTLLGWSALAQSEGPSESVTSSSVSAASGPLDHSGQDFSAANMTLEATKYEQAMRIRADARINFISTAQATSCTMVYDSATSRQSVFATCPVQSSVAVRAPYMHFAGLGALGTCNSTLDGYMGQLTSDKRVYHCNSTQWAEIKRVLPGTATLDFGSIAAQTCAELTATVSGASANDHADCSPRGAPEAGLSGPDCRTSSANTVTVRLCNVTSGAIDPVSLDYNVEVTKR